MYIRLFSREKGCVSLFSVYQYGMIVFLCSLCVFCQHLYMSYPVIGFKEKRL